MLPGSRKVELQRRRGATKLDNAAPLNISNTGKDCCKAFTFVSEMG
jgi:hypothetical protein